MLLRRLTVPSVLGPYLLKISSPSPLSCKPHQNFRRLTTCKLAIGTFGETMIIRSLVRAQAPRIASRKIFRAPARSIKTARRYSTSNAPSMASSTPQSQASMLATITTDLDKIAPRFEIQPEQITIIQTPAEFYSTLKVLFYFVYFIQFFRFATSSVE